MDSSGREVRSPTSHCLGWSSGRHYPHVVVTAHHASFDWVGDSLAGELAEMSMGESAMGKNADLPVVARPGPQMPKEMNAIGKDGHRAASEFAQACQSQDLNQIMPKLNLLTMNCMVCHASYRTR